MQTTISETTRVKRRKEAFKKQLLLVAGFKDDEIGKTDFANMRDEEFQNVVKQRLLGMMQNNGNRQRLTPLEAECKSQD